MSEAYEAATPNVAEGLVWRRRHLAWKQYRDN
jgi:hypothetical protein